MICIKTNFARPIQQNVCTRLIRKSVTQNGYMKKAMPKAKKCANKLALSSPRFTSYFSN